MFVYYSYNRKIPFCVSPLHGRKEQKKLAPSSTSFEIFDGAIFLFHCGLALYVNISTNKMIF